MKKIIIAALLVFFAFTQSNAQDYYTGIGFRGGLFNGLTVKHFVSQSNAIEGLLTSRWGGLQVAGLYEVHNQAFNTPGLNWYYGAGAHVGFWDSDNDHYDESTVIGIDGILGIEYSIPGAPINIGLDWKPELNLVGGYDHWGDGGALSIRYIF